jgi:hypothetical protein
VILFINDLLSFEFFLNFLLAVELDILLGAFVGLKYGRFNNFVNSINLLLSVLIILFYTVITAIVSKKIFMYNKKAKDKLDDVHKDSKWKKWDFLYEEVNKKVTFAGYVIAMNVVKDFLFSPFIILGIESNPIQIFPLLIVTIAISVFVIWKKPFSSALANWTLIINNINYSVVLVLFYLINGSDHLT